ncbi:PAS domain S-box protein [Azospirillum sp.]|uniref:PAS domain S-box protein n=1 Tax=Azospirillum sp. TaxID=34012 RepID=UPI002D4CA8AC|nr:PAS domain S-box protein [Azospirillum sp.]HYD70115.1 PAS domain S-box protein [Azospirillum sp.]
MSSDIDYQVICENATDSIVVHDEDGAIIYANVRAAGVNGYTVEEFKRLSVQDISARGPRYNNQAVRRVMRETIRRGAMRIEWMNRTRDGREYPVEVELKSITMCGRPRVISIARDISDRKEHERRLSERELHFRKLIENSDDGIAILEPGGRVKYVGPSILQLTGYDEAEFVRRSFLDVVDPACRAQVRAVLRKLAADGPATRMNYGVIGRDGRCRVHEASFQNLCADPNIAGILVNFRDVTERVEAEARERRHQRELEHLARLGVMGEMASATAHELNQPFAAVSNYVGGVLARLRAGVMEPQDLVPVLEKTLREAERAGRIIASLRGFTRRTEVKHEPADLNELAGAMLEFVELRARDSGVSVALSLWPEMLPVECDRVLIEQAILNIAVNGIEAMEHTPEAARWLRIETARQGDEAVVIIADNGCGLSGEQIARIFDAFYTDKPEGFGIGLSLCRSILDSHGGQLRVDSAPGAGARFSMSLPVRPSPAQVAISVDQAFVPTHSGNPSM